MTVTSQNGAPRSSALTAFTTSASSAAAVTADDFWTLIDRRNLHMAFQPIVDLATGDVVAFEALARGPEGSFLESPESLFRTARAFDGVGELDLVCRTQAIMQAARADYRSRFALFVNGEAGFNLGDEQLDPFLDLSSGYGPTVLELAERSVFVHPATLLESVVDARRRGWGIAIDDVGKTPDSLGLIGLTSPDVIKLDMDLVQRRPNRNTGLTLNAVAHQVESTGCAVVAEGIETDAHLNRAIAMGASLGQGWHFGRPGPLPDTPPKLAEHLLPIRRPGATASTPVSPTDSETSFALVADDPLLRRGPKEVLYALSLDLEAQAASQPDGAVVFACFQRELFVTGATRLRYQELATRSALVVAMGQGLTSDMIPGARCVNLGNDDPLADEWTVVVQSSHFSAALIARDCGDSGPDNHRRFDYRVTYDRDLIREACRRLLGRVTD